MLGSKTHAYILLSTVVAAAGGTSTIACLPPLLNHIHINKSRITVNAIPPYTRIASMRCLHTHTR